MQKSSSQLKVVLVFVMAGTVLPVVTGAADVEDSFLASFVAGDYAIVGKEPDDGPAYSGVARISSQDSRLVLHRRIGSTVQVAEGSIEVPSPPGEGRVLRFRWKRGEQAVTMTCLAASDLDNYPRLTCYWAVGSEHHSEPGLEALFPTAEWPDSAPNKSFEPVISSLGGDNSILDRATVMEACKAQFGPSVDEKGGLFEVDRNFVLEARFDESARLTQLGIMPKHWFADDHPEWEETEDVGELTQPQYELLLRQLDSIQAKGHLLTAEQSLAVKETTARQRDVYQHAVVVTGIVADDTRPDDAPRVVKYFVVSFDTAS